MNDRGDGDRTDEPSTGLSDDDSRDQSSSPADDNPTDGQTDAASRSDTSVSDTHTGQAASERTAAQPNENESKGIVGWMWWFWKTDKGAAVYVRDVITSVAAVLLVGFLLFAVSGIWPPMVAVESGSMEPNMNVGDLVFVVDNERFTPDEAVIHDDRTTGVVPANQAADIGYSEFNGYGDVIVFMQDGQAGQTPVIHRAMLWVDADENWYDRADPAAIGSAENCEALNNCPAPHAGFITRGDNNGRYDQVTTLSAPVKPEWIIGTAEVRIPYLGYIRLAFSGHITPDLAGDIPQDSFTSPSHPQSHAGDTATQACSWSHGLDEPDTPPSGQMRSCSP